MSSILQVMPSWGLQDCHSNPTGTNATSSSWMAKCWGRQGWPGWAAALLVGLGAPGWL